MQLTRPVASCFTYSLGKSLYIPLTSRCNACTLPETRGPNFLLPPEVVAALCRFRDAENQTETWKYWCNYLDTQDTKQKLPKAQDRVVQLDYSPEQQFTTNSELVEDDGRFPSIETLTEEIKQQIEFGDYESVVFAGEGEPTLRMGALLSIAKRIRQHHNQLPLRVTTNGLVEEDNITELLVSNGISSISVALMTHSENQYDEIMDPHLRKSQNAEKRAHAIVCDFIQNAKRSGLGVEITAVEQPGVDKDKTEALCRALGINDSVRWRPYFP